MHSRWVASSFRDNQVKTMDFSSNSDLRFFRAVFGDRSAGRSIALEDESLRFPHREYKQTRNFFLFFKPAMSREHLYYLHHRRHVLTRSILNKTRTALTRLESLTSRFHVARSVSYLMRFNGALVSYQSAKWIIGMLHHYLLISLNYIRT